MMPQLAQMVRPVNLKFSRSKAEQRLSQMRRLAKAKQLHSNSSTSADFFGVLFFYRKGKSCPQTLPLSIHFQTVVYCPRHLFNIQYTLVTHRFCSPDLSVLPEHGLLSLHTAFPHRFKAVFTTFSRPIDSTTLSANL